MVNIYKLRKWTALLIMSFIPCTGMVIGIMQYTFMIGLGIFIGCTLICIFVGNVMLNNPFSNMLEGAGILTLDLNSTGVIRPFLTTVNQPYVKGNIGADQINDVYDREAVMQLAPPANTGKVTVKGNSLIIEMDIEEFNRARFGLYQYPVLIYNSQLKTLLTKDMLSNDEKSSFAEHGVLYLNRKLEELTSIIRDFGRYVVELTKPKSSIFQSTWFKIAMVIAIIIIIALFAKPIINTIMETGGSAAQAINTPSSPVVPR